MCSCESKHRVNYFVNGEFSGINEYDTNETFYFTVSEITKNEYEKSQGINVVNDVYKKKYYSLSLYFLEEHNDEKNYITFLNLKDYGSPIRYTDDNSYNIQPYCRDSKYGFDIEKQAVYCISMSSQDNNGISAHVYLYKKGGQK